MPSKSNAITNKKTRFEDVFFSPLEKMRLKFENSKLPLKNPITTTKKPTILVDDLINAESEIGRTIFGPIPTGHQREFFQYVKNVWIWHESWIEKGRKQEITVRYEVRNDGVYKKVQGHGYNKITGAELENFRKALHAYLKVVKAKLY